MIELEQLQHFITFHECGTLSKAAKQLNISQPVLTRSMQKLEEELDVSLFTRTKNKITLNETGLFALSLAKRILEDTKDMHKQLIDFDRKLQKGVKSIVNKIADSSHAKHKKYDTFARYYCAFHNPQYYLPGHWITPALLEYERLDHFLQGEDFYGGERYIPYKKQFDKFVDFYGLQDYSTWHLHIFLTQLHSEETRVREHRFPCKDTMGYSQNTHILNIINAANRRDED